MQWSSGNPGFALTGMTNNPTDYPTVHVGGGYNGKCVKLETKDTGSFGAMVKMYIAAGNLFIGNFDVSKALAGQEGALKATTFGFQFYKHPKELKRILQVQSWPRLHCERRSSEWRERPV